MENRMKKIYLAQAMASQQHKKAVKGVGITGKTTALVHPSATIPPVVDVYGEYYRGGSTTGGWEIKTKGGRKPHHVRAAARPIATIPGLQDIMIQGGKKPKKPRTTQARPISAKPLTANEILLDNLQKELIRAETQFTPTVDEKYAFSPHVLTNPIKPTFATAMDFLAYDKVIEQKNREYEQIANEQAKAYRQKMQSKLLAKKKQKEHGTYYLEEPTVEELLNLHKKLMSK